MSFHFQTPSVRYKPYTVPSPPSSISKSDCQLPVSPVSSHITHSNFEIEDANFVESTQDNNDEDLFNENSLNEYLHTNSSDSESETNEFINEIVREQCTQSKSEKLAEWAISTKQTRKSVNSLLKILREYDPNLPKDRRTLCKTPKANAQNIVEMGQGHYLHIGLKTCLDNFLSKNSVSGNIIRLDMNVDGVPVATNTPNSLWPILINPVDYDFVLMCGTYYGSGKPADCNLYLQQFVDEFIELHENGYVFNEKLYQIEIRSIVADAPARAFLLNIKTFSGYFSCHKCRIKGLYILHRMTFPNINSVLRNDEDFKNKAFPNHHVDLRSLLIEKLPIGCVTNVPIDVMHNTFLGVTFQLLTSWIIIRRKPFSIKKKYINVLSNSILSISPQLPNEFCRKPRALQFLKRYKATQLRQLLLYTLPIITKDVLKTRYYNHFLKLHIALRILCSKTLCLEFNHHAKMLLQEFVGEMPTLYAPHLMSYNIHCLLHLADDVYNFKSPLDDFSAFKFENFLQFVKKLPKCGYNVLEQINNRIFERLNINGSITFERHKISFRLKKDGSYKFIWLNNYKFSTKAPDNFMFCREEKKMFKIYKIYHSNDSIVFNCKELKNLQSIYTESELNVDSINLGMMKCQKRKYKKIVTKQYSENFVKVAHFKFNNEFYYLSLLH